MKKRSLHGTCSIDGGKVRVKLHCAKRSTPNSVEGDAALQCSHIAGAG